MNLIPLFCLELGLVGTAFPKFFSLNYVSVLRHFPVGNAVSQQPLHWAVQKDSRDKVGNGLNWAQHNAAMPLSRQLKSLVKRATCRAQLDHLKGW